MSTLSDALAALKNAVLLQERLDVVRRELSELAATVGNVNAYAVSIDKRLVRIETMIEMSTGRGSQSRLEGN